MTLKARYIEWNKKASEKQYRRNKAYRKLLASNNRTVGLTVLNVVGFLGGAGYILLATTFSDRLLLILGPAAMWFAMSFVAAHLLDIEIDKELRENGGA